MASRILSQLCCRPRRPRNITRNGELVSSYSDLNTVKFPRSRPSCTAQWKEGWYPVRILSNPDEDGYVKVHYTGWSQRYDERIKNEDLQSIEDCLCYRIRISIKESLTAGGSKFDSKVNIKEQICEGEVDGLLKHLTVHKQTQSRKIYKITSRDQLLGILGESWDYSIINVEGDNCYIKTDTVRVYVRERKDLKEFSVTEKGISEKYISRRKQLVITFVKCMGNRRMIQHLMNDPVL